EGIGTIEGGRAHTPERLLHLIPAFAMAVKESEIQPSASATMAGFDCFLVVPFGAAEIFFLFRDAATYPIGPCRIQSSQRLSLLLGLFPTSANNARCLDIKFGEVRTGINAIGVQMDSRFELAEHPLGQTGGGEDPRFIRFFPVNPSQPQMELAIVRGERHGFFASRDPSVPLTQSKVGAAKQVVS